MPALRVTQITAVGSSKSTGKPYARPKSSATGQPANEDSTLDFPTGLKRAGFLLPTGKAVTAHQWKVYDGILRIPSGKVSTYGDIAKALGSSPRAVGGALRDNPFAPYIPCHRIVAQSGSIGGFQGEWHSEGKKSPKLEKKLALLKSEGVEFDKKGMLVGREEKMWTGQ